MSKHTPGPWYSLTIGAGQVSIETTSEENRPQTITTLSQISPNIQLITAAPEILEALIELEQNARNAAVFVPHVLLIAAVEKARSAIAKAGGQRDE